MNRTQANHAVVARRAATNGRTGRHGSPIPPAAPTAIGYVKRSSAAKLTGAQRNSLGKRSEWAASPEFFTDPKWSQTLQSQNV